MGRAVGHERRRPALALLGVRARDVLAHAIEREQNGDPAPLAGIGAEVRGLGLRSQEETVLLRKVIEGWGEHMKAASKHDPTAMRGKYARRFADFPELQAMAMRHLEDSEKFGAGD